MKALTGTRRLFRLAVRLDRIKLPVWILANVGMLALTVPQLKAAYGSPKQLIAYASASAPSAVTRLFNGSLTGPTIGEITIVETYALAILLSALMNIFLVIRHTRQNEESGRNELMESTIVGRQAALTSVLILAFLANSITAVLMYLVLIGNQLPTAGSAAYSLGIGLTGMVFAGVAAVTAQLYEGARAASGLAGLIFGVSFLIKGIGDAFGTVLPSGLSVQTSWLSWLSPLGWVPNMRPYSGELWWVPLLSLLTISVLVTLAYILLSHRDVGAAIFTPRLAQSHAKQSLLKRFGLIWRLNRVAFIAWLSSFAIFGLVLGAVADEFKDLIAGNEEMQKILAAMGGGSSFTDVMFSATFAIAGIAVAGYGLQCLTRMRSEETSGRLELLFSTAKSRTYWLLTNITFVLATVAVILLSTGFAAGLAYGIVNHDVMNQIVKLSSSILVHIPAAAIVIGLSLILFSLLPRLFVPLSWALVAIYLMMFELGAILDLPQWLMNLSPFSHTPAAPAANLHLQPLLIQSIIAICFILLSLLLFRRRDLATN